MVKSTQNRDALPTGWKDALARSEKDLAHGKIIDFFTSQDVAERDFEAAFAAEINGR